MTAQDSACLYSERSVFSLSPLPGISGGLPLKTRYDVTIYIILYITLWTTYAFLVLLSVYVILSKNSFLRASFLVKRVQRYGIFLKPTSFFETFFKKNRKKLENGCFIAGARTFYYIIENRSFAHHAGQQKGGSHQNRHILLKFRKFFLRFAMNASLCAGKKKKVTRARARTKNFYF